MNVNFSTHDEYNLRNFYITFCCSLLKKLLGYRIIHAGSQPANPVARNVHDDDAESKVRGVVQDATRRINKRNKRGK
ncbi:hypothetical protein PUN28_005516 [Cardiocondyla obscurior]|uniref:Uncharacterized protein n=1 Tax=Cardiocondyla obscurior TaxID=286306 RepID=A0AAW2GKZ8_9HYME